MNRYEKGEWAFRLTLIGVAVINLVWGIAKAIIIKWNPLVLSKESLMVYASFIVAIFIGYLLLADLIRRSRKKESVYRMDEREIKTFNLAIRNAGLVLWLGLYGLTLYLHLFHPITEKVISIVMLMPITGACALVFIGSIVYYYKKENL